MRRDTIVKVCGKQMKFKGRFPRIAFLEGEKHNFPDDPEAVIAGIRNAGGHFHFPAKSL
jgi:hypothetical protein